MDLEYGERYEAFRTQVRGFLDEHRSKRPPGHIYDMPRADLTRWLQLLIEHGYWARTIPTEYGGYGASPDLLETVIMDEEFNRAGVAPGRHRRVERAGQAGCPFVTEVHAVSHLQSLGGPRQRPPAACIAALDQVGRHLRLQFAAAANTRKRCGNDARIVEHERIAGAQQVRQLAHDAVGARRAGAYDQEPRGIARAHRMQRDAILGQLEVEEVCTHQVKRINSAPARSIIAPATRPSVISRTTRSKAPI